MLPMFLSVFLVVFIIEESGFAYLVAVSHRKVKKNKSLN